MAVPCDLPLLDVRGDASRADALLAQSDPGVWQQRSAGAGSKGHRYYDWAAHAVTVKGQPPAPGFTHTLPIRRAITPKVTAKHPHGIYEVEYFLAHAPDATDQVRKWDPWHRHVTISMLTHAFLAITRAGLGKDPSPAPPTTGPAPRTR
jgi:hypothetical protein